VNENGNSNLVEKIKFLREKLTKIFKRKHSIIIGQKIAIPCLLERQDEMESNHSRQQQIGNQFLHQETENLVGYISVLKEKTGHMNLNPLKVINVNNTQNTQKGEDRPSYCTLYYKKII
jgi:hypothetical protein